ncbi:hypothetical protein J3F84DRAFT_399706 [Trichoderma pleuroticola]
MNKQLVTLEDDGYFNLGTYHRPMTTKSHDAQRWFNRGLIWAYGFNKQEASNCFEKVITADPDCAMGYWGLAYTRGPASRQALNLIRNASPVEQALIHAIVARYPQSTPTDDYSVWNRAYADAMKTVYKQFSDDLDIVVLYPYSSKPGPKARTLDACAADSRALAQKSADKHPGLIHLHVHLMEMSRKPEVAVPSADLLRGLVPDSGHLNHMPSHIDVLIGDYQSAVAGNAAAVKADAKFVEKIGGMNMYVSGTFYRAHDYHSLIYAAMMCGQSRIALENCTHLEEAIPEKLLMVESPPMADWLKAFCAVRPHVLIRFGRWDDIINLTLPTNQSLYCVTTATIYYAKGVAYAATGNLTECLKQQALLIEALSRVPSSRMDYPNKCVDILKVAVAMLAGEIEYRRGNYEVAFEHLRQSIYLDDRLLYSEPWGWMQPARHAYAALLLEQGRVEEAVAAYAEDLGLDESLPRGHQHPNNIWALRGYHECLTLLGRRAEAKLLELLLKLATCLADIPVQSSYFCSTNTQKVPVESGKSCNMSGSCHLK